jgi:hypothetical protein
VSNGLKDLTPAELEKLAKTPIPEDKLKDLPHMKRFIISCGLYPGTAQISASIAFNKYAEWATANDEKPHGFRKFGEEFKNYFTRKRVAKGFVYLLDGEPFGLKAPKRAKKKAVKDDDNKEENKKEKPKE